MASSSRTALLLLINILFFTMVASTYVPCPPTPKTPSIPKPPQTPSIPKPPKPSSPPKKPSVPKCPKDTLKLGVCANLLNHVIGIVIGTPVNTPCCKLISGMADLEAAVCLCTAIKANVLGNNLNVKVDLSVILNTCGKKVPSGYICA